MAYAYAEVGSYCEAIAVSEAELASRRRAFGGDDPDTLEAAFELGSFLHRARRHGDAVKVLGSTYASPRRILGSSHADTLRTREWLGRARRRAPV